MCFHAVRCHQTQANEQTLHAEDGFELITGNTFIAHLGLRNLAIDAIGTARPQELLCFLPLLVHVRCVLFDRTLHLRMPLVPTPAPLEAIMRVTNDIPLGCSLL
jgi:hypothetical protein